MDHGSSRRYEIYIARVQHGAKKNSSLTCTVAGTGGSLCVCFNTVLLGVLLMVLRVLYSTAWCINSTSCVIEGAVMYSSSERALKGLYKGTPRVYKGKNRSTPPLALKRISGNSHER